MQPLVVAVAIGMRGAVLGAVKTTAVQTANEWLLRLPGLDRLWRHTRGDPAVRIAVLDGPVDPALLPDRAIRPSGTAEHGTHVYSIIVGGDGVAGIAPACDVFPISIFDDMGSERDQICTQERLAGAIQAALDNGASIINISASQQSDLTALTTELAAALEEASRRDVLIVAAAGNQGCACETIPASVPGVLAVGAHDADGAPLVSSNWGVNLRTQGVIAPGTDIPGACLGGGLCRATGTSFATAVVTGIAGLLMSLDVAAGVKPSGARVRKAILESTIAPAAGDVEIASMHLSGRLHVASATDAMLHSQFLITESKEKAMTSMTQAALADPPPSPAAAQISPAELVPADCGCGGKGGSSCGCGEKKKAQLVYAIGRLGVSFISQTRRDAIWRTVNGVHNGDLKPISDDALIALFNREPFQAQSVIWTLSRTEVPMYAIAPAGPFAAEVYKWLVTEWADKAIEFIAVPGVLAGEVTLYDGQTVPVLVPDLRGMYSWQTRKYVEALTEERKRFAPDLSDQTISTEMDRFLGKIYFSIRNRGLLPEERALNAAATNAFNFSSIIVEVGQEGLTLRDITVERSPLNRPGSEYYDVLLTFFNPRDRQGQAPLRARFTIDVSDTVPVMIGEPVTWHEY